MDAQHYPSLTPAQRREVRLAYVAEQGGLCAHCKQPLSGPPAEDVKRLRVNRKLFPPSFFKWPVHLHHDHESGMTEGAVHNHCNAVLWQYEGR